MLVFTRYSAETKSGIRRHELSRFCSSCNNRSMDLVLPGRALVGEVVRNLGQAAVLWGVKGEKCPTCPACPSLTCAQIPACPGAPALPGPSGVSLGVVVAACLVSTLAGLAAGYLAGLLNIRPELPRHDAVPAEGGRPMGLRPVQRRGPGHVAPAVADWPSKGVFGD